MDKQSIEIEQLLDDWADGSLNQIEIDQLRGILRESADARTRYVQWQMLNAALKLEGAAGGPLPLHDESQKSNYVAPQRSSSAFMTWRTMLAVAASIAMFTMVTRWIYLEWQATQVANVTEPRNVSGVGPDEVRTQSSVKEATAQGIAMVTRLVDAKWQAGTRRVEVGDALKPGRLSLESGYAQIEFFCGASVVLEGPADLELVSSTAARFLDGRLRAQVPPAARGFQIDVEGMKVVDLGTEFGISVSPSGADVQVFDGEVELHRIESEKRLVKAGEAFKHGDGVLSRVDVTPDRYMDLAALETHAQDQIAARYQRWQTYSQQIRRDSRLIAYYALDETDHWQRKLKNKKDANDGKKANERASELASELDGAIVGARRVTGRWPSKGALEFKQPGDRVRVKIPGEFRSLTFACWVKIDSLDRWYNSLFLTDNYQRGEPHWQILNTGQLFFSVRPSERIEIGPEHQEVLSPPFWTPSMSGKWLHLATTYDVDAKQTTHYLNGEQLHLETIPDEKLVTTTRIGMASIGNWSVPTKPDAHFAIRNLNGSLDEIAIFAAALSPDEIAKMHENGKP